jgi:hypothetical protein
MQDMAKALGERWRALGAEEKQPFEVGWVAERRTHMACCACCACCAWCLEWGRWGVVQEDGGWVVAGQ